MTDLTPEEQAIYDAWTVAGANPAYHNIQRNNLRRNWPVLCAAIEAIERKGRAAVKLPALPLDPEPCAWVEWHEGSRTPRAKAEFWYDSVYGFAKFAPRDGYEQDRSRYTMPEPTEAELEYVRNLGWAAS